MAGERHGHGMLCVNRLYRHGMVGERHGHGMLCVNPPLRDSRLIRDNYSNSNNRRINININDIIKIVGRDTSIGIATCYRLDGPGIDSRVRDPNFPYTFRPALGHNQPPI
jgi:hypothetical protein